MTRAGAMPLKPAADTQASQVARAAADCSPAAGHLKFAAGAATLSDQECCICQERIAGQEDGDVSEMLSCEHRHSRMHRDCLARWISARQDSPSCPLCRSHAAGEALPLRLLRDGKGLMDQGRLDEAAQTLERALNLRRRWFPSTELQIASCLNELGIAYHLNGRTHEAARLAEEAVTLKRRLLPPKSLNLAASLCNLACAYLNLGRLQEARLLLEEDIGICREAGRVNTPGMATSLIHYGAVLEAQGRYEEAVLTYGEATEILRGKKGHERDLALSLSRAGSVVLRMGNHMAAGFVLTESKFWYGVIGEDAEKAKVEAMLVQIKGGKQRGGGAVAAAGVCSAMMDIDEAGPM